MKKVVEIVKIQQVVKECKIFQERVYGSSQIGNELEKEIGNDTQEKFVLLCLNTTNKIVSYSIVNTGTLDRATVDVRGIFQRAILSNAKSIMIAHNHPSSDLTKKPSPSNQDIQITERIRKSADLLGFILLDHIIVSANSYLSFREENIVF
jgi:DNA repair protein RadC